MTVFTDFNPSPQSVFQFQPILDGSVYTARVVWNLFGQRYYLDLYDLADARILTVPLIGSPLHYDISLVAGYFTSKLVYRVSSRQFEVT